mgnify:CR=1 FL=1
MRDGYGAIGPLSNWRRERALLERLALRIKRLLGMKPPSHPA